MNFLEHMLLTWLHVFLGIGMLVILVLSVAMFSKAYYGYIEKKESCESEMEKLRRAMNVNKNEMDSRR